MPYYPIVRRVCITYNINIVITKKQASASIIVLNNKPGIWYKRCLLIVCRVLVVWYYIYSQYFHENGVDENVISVQQQERKTVKDNNSQDTPCQ